MLPVLPCFGDVQEYGQRSSCIRTLLAPYSWCVILQSANCKSLMACVLSVLRRHVVAYRDVYLDNIRRVVSAFQARYMYFFREGFDQNWFGLPFNIIICLIYFLLFFSVSWYFPSFFCFAPKKRSLKRALTKNWFPEKVAFTLAWWNDNSTSAMGRTAVGKASESLALQKTFREHFTVV